MNECTAGDLITSEAQLFINLLFSAAPIHPCLCYTSRIGSVISGTYLHLSHGSQCVHACLCACVCVYVLELSCILESIQQRLAALSSSCRRDALKGASMGHIFAP